MREIELTEVVGLHIRLGRAALGMSRPNLASMAGVGLNSVIRAEEKPGRRPKVTAPILEKIVKVLEGRGVQLLPDDGTGPGIRYQGKRK